MRAKRFHWTPSRYDTLRCAWRTRPAGQSAKSFNEALALELGTSAKIVQRGRVALGLRSNPRRVTR